MVVAADEVSICAGAIVVVPTGARRAVRAVADTVFVEI